MMQCECTPLLHHDPSLSLRSSQGQILAGQIPWGSRQGSISLSKFSLSLSLLSLSCLSLSVSRSLSVSHSTQRGKPPQHSPLYCAGQAATTLTAQ